MTEKTEAAEAKPKAPPKGAGALANLVTDFGFTAAFAFVAGIALHRGFGVSIPFIPSWLLLLTGLHLAQLAVAQLAHVWHRERVKADIDLLAASMAAQEFIEEQKTAKAFLAMDKKIKDMSAKVDGGYL